MSFSSRVLAGTRIIRTEPKLSRSSNVLHLLSWKVFPSEYGHKFGIHILDLLTILSTTFRNQSKTMMMLRQISLALALLAGVYSISATEQENEGYGVDCSFPIHHNVSPLEGTDRIM
jgi:hypothetical protein